MKVAAFVGLGSNLGNPVANVNLGLAALDDLEGTEQVTHSSLYVSAPMGPPDQPDYVNAVARLTTELDPHALLDGLQAIEAAAGRVRTGQRWGPRTLDLDMLLYGDREIADDRLQVPHPGILDRAFVLIPLAELAPDLEIPGHGSVRAAVACLDHDSVRRLEPTTA